MRFKYLHGIVGLILFLVYTGFLLNGLVDWHMQSSAPIKKYTIGMLIVATGPYISYAQKLITSAERYFCKEHTVRYFILTDGQVQESDNITIIPQRQLGWPYDTMMRFYMYDLHKATFAQCDYIFACDADMLFVDTVGSEILGNRVATRHPHLLFRRGIYEQNPLSTSAVARHEGQHYYAGAFYGGTHDQFLKLVSTIKERITIDCARGVRAWVNDESHLNRYFIDNPPTVVLGPEYCHFQTWRSPFKPKLVACDADDATKPMLRKKTEISPLDYFNKVLIAEHFAKLRYAKQE